MKYYFTDEEDISDATEIDLSNYPYTPGGVRGSIQSSLYISDIAEDIFNNRDGWEYMSDCSTYVTIIDDDGVEFDFEITTEFSPDFTGEFIPRIPRGNES